MIKAIYYQFHYTQIIGKKVTSHTNKNGQDTVYLPFLNNASVANLNHKVSLPIYSPKCVLADSLELYPSLHTLGSDEALGFKTYLVAAQKRVYL